MDLAEGVLSGDERALARAISLAEDEPAAARDLVRRLYPRTGRALVLGLTGPPGAGKSTLLGALADCLRRQGRTLGILAVDPSSPFSGGALLGDRLRLSRLFLDRGVFIRSMATRGQAGGLARAAGDAVDLLDAAGREVVLVETVGAGQGEVAIARLCHLCLVVLVPGLGDEIQALKAGMMEIADLVVLNKGDHPEADRTEAELRSLLAGPLAMGGGLGRPRPLYRTVATRGNGVPELAEGIEEALRAARESGALAERGRLLARARVEGIVLEEMLGALGGAGRADAGIAALAAQVAGRGLDPYSAAEQVLAGMKAGPAAV